MSDKPNIIASYLLQFIQSKDGIQMIAKPLNQNISSNFTPKKASPSYLNEKQACNYANVSYYIFRNWINAGLPFVQTGRKLIFSKTDIDKWIEAHKITK